MASLQPDLSPIEHLWFELKKLVYRVRPDIDAVTGSDDGVREELWKALEEAWKLTDEDLMGGIKESMERRVKACIQAKGWYT